MMGRADALAVRFSERRTAHEVTGVDLLLSVGERRGIGALAPVQQPACCLLLHVAGQPVGVLAFDCITDRVSHGADQVTKAGADLWRLVRLTVRARSSRRGQRTAHQ